jgi:hypothetical protein
MQVVTMSSLFFSSEHACLDIIIASIYECGFIEQALRADRPPEALMSASYFSLLAT